MEQCGHVKGVIYEAICKRCKEQGQDSKYIGETGRILSVRIKEHLRKISPEDFQSENNSAIGQHSCNKHGEQPSISNWDFKILDKAIRIQDRKAIEALLITKRKPIINRDGGIHIIIDNFNMN